MSEKLNRVLHLRESIDTGLSDEALGVVEAVVEGRYCHHCDPPGFRQYGVVVPQEEEPCPTCNGKGFPTLEEAVAADIDRLEPFGKLKRFSMFCPTCGGSGERWIEDKVLKPPSCCEGCGDFPCVDYDGGYKVATFNTFDKPLCYA